MRTFKLTLAYDGTDYVGWQRQANGVSIQQVVEEAFAPLMARATRRRSPAPGGPTRACTRSGRSPA